MKERIKELRKTLGLTQQEFADRLGISRGNIATYETRDGSPGTSVIALICREFNVNEKWLRTGEGETFAPKTEEEALASAVARLITGESVEFKRRLVIALSTLKDEHWLLLEEKLKEIVGTNDITPVFAPAPIPSASDADRAHLNQQADAFAAMAREQFVSEKKQESQASSAKESDAG